MNDEKTWLFINEHRNDDVRLLALQGARHTDMDLPFVLRQIAGWQAARLKIPSWAACERILYPQHLSMEQCSSEQTASYKANICRRLFPADSQRSTLTDLTGGLGVDFSWMAREFHNAIYVEQQETLCQLARHNMPLLGLKHAQILNTDSATALNTIPQSDMIFIDPARRDQHGARTFAIADCQPDILALEDILLSKAVVVMVKLSPMLDWHKAVEELERNHPGAVREIHILAVANECKELLLVLSGKREKTETTIYCHNDAQELVFGIEETDTQHTGAYIGGLDECRTYHFLYEPNAAVMKAGNFGILSSRWPVRPLAHNSHLFLSDKRLNDFPGRGFQIDRAGNMSKQQLRQLTKDITKANITVRNMPLDVAQLRRKLHLKEGGDTYIFGSTTEDCTHVLFVCRKI